MEGGEGRGCGAVRRRGGAGGEAGRRGGGEEAHTGGVGESKPEWSNKAAA